MFGVRAHRAPTFIRAPPAVLESRARSLIEATCMQVPSALHDKSPTAAGQAKENCEKIQAAAEEMENANVDAVFEAACRYIVLKSLPGWIDEIYGDHLQADRPAFRAE
jgi:hypothetical protein